MNNLFLKDTIVGFIILLTTFTLGYFAPESIVALLVVAVIVTASFLTGFLVSLILEGFKDE